MQDTFDANKVTQRLQHGLQPSFFPIVLDMTAAATGVEYLANITPCDSIWIPTFFDASLGLNPIQTQLGQPLFPPSVNQLVSGPNYNRISGGTGGSPVGMNIFDAFSVGPAIYHQAATIFSLRFNSVSSPWLLWGLSNLLSTDFGPQTYAIGQGDCMRSISGPIARMWYKKIAPAIINGNPNSAADRVVLMSSQGYSQQTAGVVCGPLDGSGATPPAMPSQSAYGTVSGGYEITTLNSYDQLRLNLPEPGQLR